MKATKKASALALAPTTAAMATSRTSPSTREAMVMLLTSKLDRRRPGRPSAGRRSEGPPSDGSPSTGRRSAERGASLIPPSAPALKQGVALQL
ncbi:hypothetical protein GCM10027428_29800 [Haliea atlantica]